MPPLLFSLPREVRDEIYEYVYPYGTSRPVTRDVDNVGQENNTLALRLVNRQISVEATIHFYSSSIFSGNPTNLIDFLERIGDCRNLIKRIGLENGFPELTGRFPWARQAHIPQLMKIMNTLSALQTIEMVYEEDSLTLGPRLSEWIIARLDCHAELVVCNRSFRKELSGLSDDGSRLEPKSVIGVWTLAKGAAEWKKDKDDHEGHPASWKDL